MVSSFLSCVVVLLIDCTRSLLMSLYIDTRRTLSFDDRGRLKFTTPPRQEKIRNSTTARHTLKRVALHIKPNLGYPSRWVTCTYCERTTRTERKHMGTYNHEGKTPLSPSPHFSPSLLFPLLWLLSFLLCPCYSFPSLLSSVFSSLLGFSIDGRTGRTHPVHQ